MANKILVGARYDPHQSFENNWKVFLRQIRKNKLQKDIFKNSHLARKAKGMPPKKPRKKRG